MILYAAPCRTLRISVSASFSCIEYSVLQTRKSSGETEIFAIDTESLQSSRDDAIVGLMGYARVIAVRMHRALGLSITRSIDVEDLIAEAYTALIRAVDAFDPARGVPLRGFAGGRISGHLRHVIRDTDPKGRYNRQTLIRCEKFISRFMIDQEREPTRQEIEEAVPGYNAALQRSDQRSLARLDEHAGGGKPNSNQRLQRLSDFIPSTDPAVEDVVAQRLDVDQLVRACSSLSPLERKILLMRLRDGSSIRAIAKTIGLSTVGTERMLERARKIIAAEVGS